MSSDGEDLESLAASLRSFKGHLTRKIYTAEKILGFATTRATSVTLAQLQEALTQLDAAFSKVENACTDVQRADPANFNTYEESFQTEVNRYMKCKDDVLDAIQTVSQSTMVAHAPMAQAPRQAGAAAAAPQPAAGAGGGEKCPRPFVLSATEHTPIELRHWTRQFKAFYTSTNMNRSPLHEQHAHFYSFIDAAMASRIVERIREDTPIFSANPNVDDKANCMHYVSEEFAQAFPLFARRHRFFQMSQAKGQPFTAFATSLRAHGDEADVQHMSVEDIYVMRYILACSDPKLKEKFLELANPTLDDLNRIATNYEVPREWARQEAHRGAAARHDGKGRPGNKPSKPKSNSSGSNKGSGSVTIKFDFPNVNKFKEWLRKNKICQHCGSGKEHPWNECKAKDAECSGCNGKGRYKRVCFGCNSKEKSAGTARNSRIVEMTDRVWRIAATDIDRWARAKAKATKANDGGAPNKNDVGISDPTPRASIDLAPFGKGKPFVFDCTPDSGATISCVSYDLCKKHGWNINRSDKKKLKAVNGTPVLVDGSVEFKASYFGKMAEVKALVSSMVFGDILLGWRAMIDLGILPENFPMPVTKVDVTRKLPSTPALTVDQIADKYPDIFDEKVKPMNVTPMEIELIDDKSKIKPRKVLTARAIPVHLRPAADKLLKKLLADDIIEKVDEPTDWCHAAFFVPKPNSDEVRLVMDPSALNAVVKRPVMPFACIRDIIKCIKPSSERFGVIDLKQAYHQVPLSVEASKLTTFILPSGRYRYKRNVMGLSSANDVFLARSTAAFEGIDGLHQLVDDILLEAPDEQSLLEKMDLVLQRCQQHGMTLKRSKLAMSSSVRFGGYIISKEGCKPDGKKLEAISKIEPPSDLTGLRSFLGAIQQLAFFVPDMSQITEPLRQLTKKGVAWLWLPEHQEAFEKAKSVLTSDLVAGYFDPAKETVIVTDASRLKGLGWALLQRDKTNPKKTTLIQCGSRSLTDTETRWATVELEMLGLQWSIEQCRFYLLGCQDFLVIVDHRPLCQIVTKDLADIRNARLLRLREKLACYNFHVEWQPGKHHFLADHLSRHPVWDPPEGGAEDDPDLYSSRFACVQTLASDPALQTLFDAAADDASYKAVVEAIKSGKSIAELKDGHPGREFKNVWDELSIHEDTLLILDGDRIVVPKASRPAILSLLHASHSGIVRTRELARQNYFWHGMNSDVKNMIDACTDCQALRPSLPAEPHLQRADPTAPMEVVASDLFQLGPDHYLILYDQFSGFCWSKKLNRLDTKAVTNALHDWFVDWGLPSKIETDGGPQYRQEFKAFLADLNIKHELSSPYHPQGNLAECGVKIVKHLLIKANGCWKTFQKSLLEYRNTPRSGSKASPAELFFSRKQRTALPTLGTKPSYAAIAARPPRPPPKPGVPQTKLATNDKVLLQDPISKRWDSYGYIIAVRDSGRSYVVHDELKDKQVLRNRKHLRPHSGGLDKSKPTEKVNDKKSPGQQIPRRSPRLKAKHSTATIRSLRFSAPPPSCPPPCPTPRPTCLPTTSSATTRSIRTTGRPPTPLRIPTNPPSGAWPRPSTRSASSGAARRPTTSTRTRARSSRWTSSTCTTTTPRASRRWTWRSSAARFSCALPWPSRSCSAASSARRSAATSPVRAASAAAAAAPPAGTCTPGRGRGRRPSPRRSSSPSSTRLPRSKSASRLTCRTHDGGD